MAALYLSLIFVGFQLHFAVAFMPNHVFSFALATDVESPFTASTVSVDDGSCTHQDIIRRACLEEVARFYEETLTSCRPSESLQGLDPLTAETLLEAVVDKKTSILNFELALQEIEIEATLMDVWHERSANRADQATVNARQHFDNEKIKEGHNYLLETARTAFSALNAESYSAARTFVGRYLHALQDFYSHSNWIELGNTEILDDLGTVDNASFLSNIAGPEIRTCSDCSRCAGSLCFTCNTCFNNMKTRRLTSGYFMSTPYEEKPLGKCSHGDITDRSSKREPRGGINKSTKNCRKSPHHHLHDEACRLATRATRNFLARVRATTGNEAFRNLFNLGEADNVESDTSLCFVIDRTGSMKDHINAVKNRAIQIVESSTKPRNYVLVQFGDYDINPAYSLVVKTNDANVFLAKLNKLKTKREGDCPELTLHGLQLALSHCLPGSNIFVFTDGGTKDVELTNTVHNLIDGTGSRIYFFYTGRSRHPCSSNVYRSLYTKLATRSGGQLLPINRQTVVKGTSLTQTVTEGANALLLAVKKRSRSGTYPFSVDCTITTISVSVTGSRPHLHIQRPDGSTYTKARSTKNYLFVTIPEKDIVEGNWTVVVKPLRFREHTVIVQAASSVDFLYQFVAKEGRPGHLGVFPIIGQPPQGKVAKVLVTVAGLTALVEVTHLVVLTESGDILRKYPLEQGRRNSSNTFGAAFIPHQKQPFRLGVHALDRCNGQLVIRLKNALITSPTMFIHIYPPTTELVKKPGNYSDVVFERYSSGKSTISTFFVTHFDGKGLVPIASDVDVIEKRDISSSDKSQLEKRVFVKTGQAAVANVTFAVAEDVRPGKTDSATVVVSDGDSFRYVDVEAIFGAKVTDDFPPLCDIQSYTRCNLSVFAETCDNDKWHVVARVVDLQLGLQHTKSADSAVHLTHKDFRENKKLPVYVTAVASCCHRDATFIVSDDVGNRHTCTVSLPPQQSF